MKKTVVFGLLAIVLAFGFIGCDTDGVSENNDYTVTFNLDGGIINGNSSSVPIIVKNGGTIDNLPQPQKANNTFGGWFTATNGAGNEFKTTTIVTSNVTVFAKWTPTGNINQFTVTFDLDGGNISGNTSNVLIIANSGATVAILPNPIKANYTFDGWFTEKNGAGTSFTTSTVVTSNVTVFAKWTAASGGNGNDPFSGTWESTFSEPPPEKFRFIAENGSFSYDAIDEFFNGGVNGFLRGTYTVTENTVNATITQVNINVFPGGDNVLKDPEWVAWDNLNSEWNTILEGSQTFSFTITGNQFIITSYGMTFTKQ